MCGIVGLHLRNPLLYPDLGLLLTGMLDQLSDRGLDSAGMAIYGDPHWSPTGHSTVSLLNVTLSDTDLAKALTDRLRTDITAIDLSPTILVHGAADHAQISSAVREVAPDAGIIGFGADLAVLKGVGYPSEWARSLGLTRAQGWQGVAHTRMATESAVTAAGSHPFSVGPDQCLVHNGSFSNYMTVKHDLERHGVVFDSENDTEVAARFIASQLGQGADLEKAITLLQETFDGFYTLLISNSQSFAVVRDAISCKPAVIAETDQWVAMASEYRALAHLPGVKAAEIFEPKPEEVYLWHRR